MGRKTHGSDSAAVILKVEINGDVLPGGADAQWMKPDGATAVADARYMIKTTLTTVPSCTAQPWATGNFSRALERLNKGEPSILMIIISN